MSVDVDGFVVYVAQAGGGFAVGVRGGPVAGADVVVVLLPGGEVAPRYGQRALGLFFDCIGDFLGLVSYFCGARLVP